MSDIVGSPPSSAPNSQGQPSSGYLKRDALIGKSVISRNAELIGTVRDIAVSMDGRVAIQVDRKKEGDEKAEQDLFIGSDEIQAMGDVILLKTTSEMAGKGMPPQQPSAGTTVSRPAQAAPMSSAGPSLSSTDSRKPPAPPYPPNLSSSGKTCQKCGYINSASSRFCIKCGASL